MCQVSGTCSGVQKSLTHLSIVITIHNMHFFFQLSYTMLACVALHSRPWLDCQKLQQKAQQQEIYFSFMCPYGLFCSLRNQALCNYHYLPTVLRERKRVYNSESSTESVFGLTACQQSIAYSEERKREVGFDPIYVFSGHEGNSLCIQDKLIPFSRRRRPGKCYYLTLQRQNSSDFKQEHLIQESLFCH